MHINKIVFLGVILWIIPGIAIAQNSTNSPYTRYGYGILADKSFISQRGMGGIGYGLRNSQMINPMNPASFSSIDSMTFMFDLGVTGQVSWLKDGLDKEQKVNGNLEYIAFQIPVAKRLGVGIGFEPVSYVGYSYTDTARLPVGNDLVQNIYTGIGGLSRVYTAVSYDLFSRISIGVKLSYLFGDITHNKLVTFSTANNYSTTWADTVRSAGFLYDFGLQYHFPVGKFKIVTLGAVYTPKTRYSAKVMTGVIRSDPNTGEIMNLTNTVSTDSVFEMPETYCFGITYNQLGKITIGADVLYQKWTSAKYFDQTNVFNNRLKLNAGGEYIPNRTSNNLLNRIHYRGGLFYTNSYLKIYDSKYNEYGINFGLGIPIQDLRIQDRRSFLNLAIEYSLLQPESNLPISERYFKVSFSYTFNELWFFKRKVQ